MGRPTTRICQNCTILIRPSTEYNIDPRKPWTETWCPVSSNTSRLAAASACSPGLSLPFGRTQDLSLRNRTIAMRGLLPSPKTIPPAARIGDETFASGRRCMAVPRDRERRACWLGIPNARLTCRDRGSGGGGRGGYPLRVQKHRPSIFRKRGTHEDHRAQPRSAARASRPQRDLGEAVTRSHGWGAQFVAGTARCLYKEWKTET